jgi:hypothetical protein
MNPAQREKAEHMKTKHQIEAERIAALPPLGHPSEKTGTVRTKAEKALRKQLLKPYFTTKDDGDTQRFRMLPLKILQKLIDNDFVDRRSDGASSLPSVAQVFLPFMKRHPSFTAHGYAVDWKRDDHRVSIEGLDKTSPLTKEEMRDFSNTFHKADEFEIAKDCAGCWFD